MKIIKPRPEPFSLIPNVPVRRGKAGKPFMRYELDNLFDYYGNGDGDNLFLCEIAERILSSIERRAKVTITCVSSLHNSSCIDQITGQGIKWENPLPSGGLLGLTASMPQRVLGAIIAVANEGVDIGC